MDQPTFHPGTLYDYWSLLLRRRAVIAAVFAVVTVVVAIGAFTAPARYTAQTTVMVKFGREFMYRPEVGDSSRAQRTFKLGEMVNSEVEILSSRDVAEQVIRQMGPGALFPGLAEDEDLPEDLRVAQAVRKFQESLSVMDVLESGVIKVCFDHADPKLAADALNVLVEKFKDKHVEVFGSPTPSFLEGQLERFRDELIAAETALEEFRRTRGVHDLDRQRALVLEQRIGLDTELTNLHITLAELENQRAILEAQAAGAAADLPPHPPVHDRALLERRRTELASALQEADFRTAELDERLGQLDQRSRSAATFPAHPGVEDYRSLDEGVVRLLDLRLQEKELLRNYKEDNRQVVGVREELAMVEEFLQERSRFAESVIEASLRDELVSLSSKRELVVQEIQRLDAEILAVDLRVVHEAISPREARAEKIARELASLDGELGTLAQRERELRELKRQVSATGRNVDLCMARTAEARMTEELDREKMISVRVLEKAAPPLEPSGLPRKTRIGLGMLVGLMAGIAAALGLEIAVRPW